MKMRPARIKQMHGGPSDDHTQIHRTTLLATQPYYAQLTAPSS